MGYNPNDHKESNTTEQLTLSFTPALQADSLLSELPGTPLRKYMHSQLSNLVMTGVRICKLPRKGGESVSRSVVSDSLQSYEL